MVRTRYLCGGCVSGAWLAMALGASGQTLVSPNPEQWSDFGAGVAAVPDVNGDGRGEMAVGAPAENHGGLLNAGRAYLFNSNGTRRFTLISPTPQNGGGFGRLVAGIPDTNSDGFGDLAVAEGLQVHVFSGFTGLRRLTLNALSGSGALAGLKDVTGDGRGDLAVGAPGFWAGGGIYSPVGRVYIYNGLNGALVRHLDSPSDQASNSEFGAALASVPDINGDNRPELVIGAPRETSGDKHWAGRVYVFSAANGQHLRTLTSPHNQADGLFGTSVAGVPDVNNDGWGDILIGAPEEIVGNNPDAAGRAYLYSGRTGALLRQFGSGNPGAYDRFGCSVAGVGDLNGDGRGDIIIGCKGKSPLGFPAKAGRVYIYSGATGAFLRGYASPNQEAGGAFGGSVAGLADTNGDGRGDVGVGAQYEDIAPVTDAGRAYMFRY